MSVVKEYLYERERAAEEDHSEAASAGASDDEEGY